MRIDCSRTSTDLDNAHIWYFRLPAVVNAGIYSDALISHIFGWIASRRVLVFCVSLSHCVLAMSFVTFVDNQIFTSNIVD